MVVLIHVTTMEPVRHFMEPGNAVAEMDGKGLPVTLQWKSDVKGT